MDVCHGGGEERDELESVSHFVRTGEGEETVPQYLLFGSVLSRAEELLTSQLDPAALQELGLSHRAKPATVSRDLAGKSFLILSAEKIRSLTWARNTLKSTSAVMSAVPGRRRGWTCLWRAKALRVSPSPPRWP